MNDSRPSWLLEECPPWCVAEHAEEDHPDDRQHHGVIVTVPVVLRQQALRDGCLMSSELASEFDVVRFQLVGSVMRWLFVGDDEHQLELSEESALRLTGAIGATARD